MGVWIPGLFATTFYLPSRVVRQFRLLQDTLEDTFVDLLRGLILCPSAVVVFATAWHDSITALFRRVPAFIILTTEYIQAIQAPIDDHRHT